MKGLSALSNAFTNLLRETIKDYCKNFPDNCEHVKSIRHYDEMGKEFCDLYAKDFYTWKYEHNL